MAANLFGHGVLLRLASVVVHPVICLDISVELNRIETVNIGLAREPRGIIKRDLQSAMLLDMCSCRRAPLSTAFAS
jgi:hypothetical protein